MAAHASTESMRLVARVLLDLLELVAKSMSMSALAILASMVRARSPSTRTSAHVPLGILGQTAILV